MAMRTDGLYHQPRWVNAIFIAGCVPVIVSGYVMSTQMSRPVILVGTALLFLFVGVCNKLRAGAVFPRWAEAARLAKRLDSEHVRRITKAELATLTTAVSGYDIQPPSLRVLSQAVRHIATDLRIAVRENWLLPDHSRANEAIEFHTRTTIVRVDIRDGKYDCGSHDADRPDERSVWSEERTAKLAWTIAGHPFDSKSFRQVYFSMPSPGFR
jgi:hypothetical protein